ncbi:cobalamin biosynthesis bifunctional protein CbiET [Thiohalocapsa halophila]|uniref:Cobalamin biosynthesis bifunctional protein CbiET n=1 Tax=Thiohalocapsa halophila TaxID=69359 RepID=A0ABS1CGX7_9GAMM|nr:precorrin-6y C5,15-methyltransferase (decarboxylating) subunit CbiE [Thiohalocapsa halophila]MBK1631170.1 cobalamin biosynthesis bifunctional protein CbiET [Thiohalocapsa halophila]
MSTNAQSAPTAGGGPWLSIVGIGEDGPAGLGKTALGAIAAAEWVFGARRHLELLPTHLDGQGAQQRREPWPQPFDLAFERVFSLRGSAVCVLASGDPMWFGAGAKLAARLAPGEYRVLPALSSTQLAAARLGWPLQDATVLRPVSADPPLAPELALTRVRLHLADGARLLILSADARTPGLLAELLRGDGWGASVLTVFERLGGPAERRREAAADHWAESDIDPLNLIAVVCRAPAGWRPRPRRTALPDDAFSHDGQLTKRDVRALTLSRLAPGPGELLWDVGAGCGSIGIEWMRSEDGCRALAIEPDAGRRGMIAHNAAALGVPELVVVAGRAPDALADLPAPDAVFIGGGLTAAGIAERCWAALRPGGRLVANAVTLQSEAALAALRAEIGGALTRVQAADAAPLGRFDGWRPAMPITILAATKPGDESLVET